jgi:hypothetical protein
MNDLTTLLRHLIQGTEKASGKPCDTIVVGSDRRAGEVLAALQELGRDFHVIADDEISPSRIYVTSQAALGLFKGGGQN